MSAIVNQRTSDPRSRIGVSPITAEIQDKYAHLKEEFSKIDTDGDHKLSFQEVYTFFNEKSKRETGQPFDEEMCKQLFKKLDRNQDNEVTIEEIILAYCDEENLIYKQVEERRKEISDAQAQIANIQKKKREAEEKDTYNENDIMDGSILRVNVIEASNLIPMDWGVSSDPYVVLDCENQRATTEIIQNNLHPLWDEVFSFEIKTGKNPLIVTVMNDHGDNDDFEGRVEIQLNDIKDQQIHDRFYDLKHFDVSKKWQGRIHLSLQWIWNQQIYYSGLEEQWEITLKTKQKEIDDLYEQLDKLRKPFGLMSYCIDMQVAPVEVVKVPGELITLAKTMSKLDHVSNDLDYAVSQVMFSGNAVPWNVASYVLTYLLLIVSTMVMFFRSDFGNVSLSI